jgi:kynureninase
MRQSGDVLKDLGPYPDTAGYDLAIQSDSIDPLREFRQRYLATEPDLVYLDGNSLGRAPHGVVGTVESVVSEEWADRLIQSWNDGWWDLQLRLGDKMAPLVGASSGEVIISDSTTVNLYKLAMAAVDAAGQGRTRIVTDDLNFPSDVYILEAIARAHGGELVVVPSDGIHGPVAEIESAIDDTTALVSLSHTTFQSGYTYDMSAVTDLAHTAGAMVLWDCSHSVGAIPIDFRASQVDLAVGCTYKYLNGGPGSPAFLYVRSDLQDTLNNPITGWWGHRAPFDLDLVFEPVSGIRRFHTGTMPILSLKAVEPGLDDVLVAGIGAIRAKSELLTSYLVDQWGAHLEPLGFDLASPADPSQRGSHITLRHDQAWPINRAMIVDAKVVPDFRAPDTIRLGLAPLYTGFLDIHTAIQRVKRVIEAKLHLNHLDDKATVT